LYDIYNKYRDYRMCECKFRKFPGMPGPNKTTTYTKRCKGVQQWVPF